MKKILFVWVGGLYFCISNASASAVDPTNKTLSAALTQHLAKQGDLCIGKFNWPIEVSQNDIESGSRDALQMPVLEKLGLVALSTGFTLRKENGETEEFVPVNRYSLTDEGKKFYLEKQMTSLNASGKSVSHQGDVCVAKLSLDKIVSWEKPKSAGGYQETTATYTYKVTAVDWAKKPEVQKVFPMVERIIKGEGSMQLQQRVRLNNKIWVAVNPWE